MRLLGIESSGLVASAAILDGDIIKAEYTVNTKLTHSQTLLPMIDEIVQRTGTDLNTLDAIAISAGPGSFTGLRIGAATAKGLCLALEKPLIAVPTLDSMIYGCGECRRTVIPIMDARRNQVYTKYAGKTMACDIGELLALIHEPVLFVGDAIPVYRERIEAAGIDFAFAPAHLNRQRAAAVAAWAAAFGTPEDADAFAPEYLRKSQAEREREEAMKAQTAEQVAGETAQPAEQTAGETAQTAGQTAGETARPAEPDAGQPASQR